MFKICLIVVLALAGVQAQNAGNGESAAPEPYSYGYQTDTHAASEQRDPSGTVTGYYMLADADGRQRRVDYIADGAGFRAKVATNEVGTKSENSADVEVQAAPATDGQLAQQAPVVQQVQRVSSQQVVSAPQRTAVSYVQQPGYGYSNYGYSGYPYSFGGYRGYNGYAGYNGAYNNGYGSAYGLAYPYGYGSYNGAIYGGYNGANGANGYSNGAYYTYNNHLPSQYYRSIGQPIAYGAQGASRYVSTSGVGPASSSVYSSGYQTVGVPTSAGYQTVPAVSSSRSSSSSSGISGSSNYILLQKRDSQAAEKATVAKSS